MNLSAIVGITFCSLATCFALEPQNVPSESLLTPIFKECVRPEQIAGLGTRPSAEQIAAIMSREQKDTARVRLHLVEAGTTDQARLAEVERGYTLLGFPGDVLRLQAQRGGFASQDSGDLTKKALAAYDEGRIQDAVKLAAEALSRNPEDESALAILKLAEPKLSDVHEDNRRFQPELRQGRRRLG